MKYLVTHRSPDLDAITSVWLIKRFLPGWQEAVVKFVPAGEKFAGEYLNVGEPIEKLSDESKIIHVDTGLGALDHHQIESNDVCGASLTLQFVMSIPQNGITVNEIKKSAAKKVIDFVVDDDHFQEVYYSPQVLEMYGFSISRLLDGFKLLNPQENEKILNFGMQNLDALLENTENKLWAEKELDEKKIEFETRFGKGMGVETINDAVLEAAQDQGYAVVIRRDLDHGFIRIKAKPEPREKHEERLKINDERITNKKSVISNHQSIIQKIDLTPAYEKLKELDPEASWFLHVSKKMLLNGSTKKPEMHTTKLTLEQVIEVVREI